MDSKAEMYMKRARTEIDSAFTLFESSGNQKIKEILSLDAGETFYSGAISHAYYAIFYCAKAMLLTKGIETESPEIHKRTFDGFKTTFIDTGILDAKLLLIYRELIIRAEILLGIYREEKKKRGDFTYNTIPQANRIPAEESIKNAKTFLGHCSTYLHG
jgi:uncharacterized protein (UPF0332 family)